MTTSKCGIVFPLSASVGGSPVLITSTAAPGQVVHANPIDSGGIDVFSPLVIVNSNPSTVTLYKAVTGPSIPTPVWHRHDIPATNEGQEPTRVVTPTVLEADFNLSMYVEPLPGYQPVLVYGDVDRFGAAGFFGYGGLDLITPVILGDGTLDTGWDTFPFGQGALAEPVNVGQDPANNRIQFLAPGVWSVNLFVIIEFVSSNSGRTTRVRFFNETKSVASSSDPLYVGRDQEGVNAAFTFLADVPSSEVGDWFRIEIGGGDTFAGVTAEGGGFTTFKLGET